MNGPINVTKLLTQLGATTYENLVLREALAARNAEIEALKMRLEQASTPAKPAAKRRGQTVS